MSIKVRTLTLSRKIAKQLVVEWMPDANFMSDFTPEGWFYSRQMERDGDNTVLVVGYVHTELIIVVVPMGYVDEHNVPHVVLD